MNGFSEYINSLFGGIKSLLKGMQITLRVFFRKKSTEQYPENRSTLVMFDGFRGSLMMPHNEQNEHQCTACGICQMNCPNGTIAIESESGSDETGKSKKALKRYDYDLGKCIYCQLCVRSCPSDAIRFTNTFEHAVFTRSKLMIQLNQEGSKLKAKKNTPTDKVELS